MTGAHDYFERAAVLEDYDDPYDDYLDEEG